MSSSSKLRTSVVGLVGGVGLAVVSLGCTRGGVAALDHRGVVAALVIQRPALYPETIEYDASKRRFLVGSVREGAVYEVDDVGRTKLLVDDPRLCSVLGIAIDAPRGRLLVVNADLGASLKPSAAGPKKLAGVGIYDLATGAALDYVDLAGLVPAPHLLNGIAVDASGNAYVIDSFAPVIYKIDIHGQSTIFVRDEQLAGEGISLNGLVVHPDGYLLVIKKSDGALFKVPLDGPRRVAQVAVPVRFVGGDGLVLVSADELVIVANQVPGQATNAAFSVASDDGWTTARVRGVQPLGDVYPTTAVLRDGNVFVLHSKLSELIEAPPERKGGLQMQATIQPIAPFPVRAPSAQVTRKVLQRSPIAGTDDEVRLMMMEFPPGAASARHRHPVAGVCYVLEGTAESQYEGEALRTLHAGDSYIDPATRPHLVFRNVGRTPLRFTCAARIGVEQPFMLPL